MILADIYGKQDGPVAETGLVHIYFEDDFKSALESLEEKWNQYIPDFFIWWCDNRKKLFIQHVIGAAASNLKVHVIPSVSNDLESLHAAEKRRMLLTKTKSLTNCIETLNTMSIAQHEEEEVKAVYGAGKYRLSPEYETYHVNTTLFHRWNVLNKSHC